MIYIYILNNDITKFSYKKYFSFTFLLIIKKNLIINLYYIFLSFNLTIYLLIKNIVNFFVNFKEII